MSNSLQLFFKAAQETLRLDYQSGDETLIEYPHSTGWRTLPAYAMITQIVGADLVVEDEQGRVWHVNDRDAVCIPPGMHHKIDHLTPGSAISRWSHVNIGIFGSTSMFTLLKPPIVFSGEVAQQLGDINAELAQLHKLPLPELHQVLRKQSLGFQLAALLAESALLFSPSSSELQQMHQFEPLLKYIEEHLDQPLTREDLAAFLHLSPSRFYVLFRKVIGVAPSDYVQNVRMRKARELLLLTDWSVHEVARSVGYNDLFHFSRVFKKHYELSPMHYRQQFQA